MHSPRQATSIRPSSPLSPLSPRFDPSSRYQSPQPQSARSYGPRGTPSTQQRRNHGSSLALPGLPRFHPANFPSSHSSVGNTPGSGPVSPQMSLSPQMQQKMVNDVQKQLYLYQQEISARSGPQVIRERPTSPRLVPLGSPGPVTPLALELEEEDNYLAAGSRTHSAPTAIECGDELAARMSSAARSSKRPPLPISRTKSDGTR
ncbi:hypothetical protein MBLNU457_6803t2 [Dothideomycetes sp. NU457]